MRHDRTPSQAAGGLATAPEQPAVDSHCPHCQSTEPWGLASWCPSCGYYPALGTTVGASAQPEPATGGADAAAPRNVWEAVPAWVWLLTVGLVVVAAVSFAANVLLPAKAGLRAVWTLAQCGIGLLVFGVAHLASYLVASAGSNRFGPADILLKPVEVWKPTFQTLPSGAQRVCLAAWGQSAAICALLFIGGVKYSAIFDDWGVQASAKPNLVQAIVAQARKQQEGGADSLEEAVADFTGADEGPPARKLPRTDCLIFGYTAGADGFDRLLLATAVAGKLQFVGSLPADAVPPDVRAELDRRLPTLEQETPFVKSPVSGRWLKPVLMCRIAHDDWKADGKLREPQFDALLRDLD